MQVGELGRLLQIAGPNTYSDDRLKYNPKYEEEGAYKPTHWVDLPFDLAKARRRVGAHISARTSAHISGASRLTKHGLSNIAAVRSQLASPVSRARSARASDMPPTYIRVRRLAGRVG